MEITNYPIEGDFFQTDFKAYFEVKDFHQSDNQSRTVIAFIRYYFDEEKEKFIKIKDLKKREEFLKSNFPNILHSNPNYYFPLQKLSYTIIKKHLMPEKFLYTLHITKNTWEKSDVRDLRRDCYDFCALLSEKSQVPLEKFGITGSILLGIENEKSDIDIIVYGYGNSLRVREYIHKCYQMPPSEEINNTNYPKRYTLIDLKTLYKERAKGSTISFLSFLKYEVRKYHQGTFRGRDFFIRYLEFENREEYKDSNHYNKRKIVSLGRIRISAQIRDDKYWWTTPAKLGLANINILDKSRLEQNHEQILLEHGFKLQEINRTFTLRGRYIENARLLEFVEIQGTLELIIPDGEQPILQIALGTDPQDYLIQS